MSEETFIHEYNTFDEMKLKDTILRGIYGYGFEVPSAIQSQSIIPVSNGSDVIAQAQSGTGKTAAFITGILQRLDESLHHCQAMILSPTRELTTQTYRVLTSLSNYMDIHCHMSIGGHSINEDQRIIKKGVQVIVGTPGRIFDLMDRNILQTTQLRMLVIDEADEMLSVGFKDQIRVILENIPRSCTISLFSATMPEEMIHLTEKFMTNPIRIIIKREEITLEGIQQYYVNVEKEEWKLETLLDLYEQISINQAILFCNTRRTVEWLAKEMNDKGFTVSAFHSELEQSERDRIMNDFRSGASRVLISTDILGRGIDVQQVSIVFNYDIPNKKENYIHRIGRSGRFGRKGIAINFITDHTIHVLQEIQHFYSTTISELPFDMDQLCIK